MSSNDILMSRHLLTHHAEGVYTAGAQGNSLVVDRGDSLLLVDAGPGGEPTDRLISQLRESIGQRVGHIDFSHGHMGYNNGIVQWLDDAARRGAANRRR